MYVSDRVSPKSRTNKRYIPPKRCHVLSTTDGAERDDTKGRCFENKLVGRHSISDQTDKLSAEHSHGSGKWLHFHVLSLARFQIYIYFFDLSPACPTSFIRPSATAASAITARS